MFAGRQKLVLVGRTNRRGFIAGLGGVAAWPVVARGQVRSIGGLFPGYANAEIQRVNIIVLTDRLRELGWTEGKNVHLEARYSGGDLSTMRANARELVVVSSGRDLRR